MGASMPVGAKVATGASTRGNAWSIARGEAAFLLVGSGQGERHGHMAVIERPRSIDYDAEGQVQRIVFDGWESATRRWQAPHGARLESPRPRRRTR